jgi:tripartite-type tricarboxylate transporter receptor subunit TctC
MRIPSPFVSPVVPGAQPACREAAAAACPPRARRRLATVAWLVAAAAALLPPVAAAQSSSAPWPSRAVTIVSPYPAGGITDQLSRIVAEEFGRKWGQPFIVENRTGAGGALAMGSVARAAADGYTLVMGGSAVSTIVPALNPNVSYDPVKDFEPIGYVAALPIVLVAHPSLPPTLPEFIAHAKANADRLNCAHHGPGTGTHLACILFARKLGVRIADVAYRGAPQVNQDLLANRVQFYFGTLPTQVGFVRAGQLRAYGMASDRRVSFAPDIPTLEEQGVTGLNLDSWNALYAPAGTPAPVLAQLSAELQRVMAQPEVRKRVEATGSITRPGTADDLRKLTLDELAMYRKLAAETGVRAQ